MAGVFDLELHDAPDPEFISDDEAAGTEIDTTLNVTEIEVSRFVGQRNKLDFFDWEHHFN